MKRYIPKLFLLLLGAQLLLFLASWLTAAVAPQWQLRSLLSSEGLRWFFGSFVDNITTPALTWLLLAAMAVGVWQELGVRSEELGVRSGLRLSPVVWAELALIVVVMVLLTAVPHAILLSATGTLFPSSFSRSIVPVASFAAIVCGITVGITNDRLHSLADVYRALTAGLRSVAVLLPLYIVAAELVASLLFVFRG